jgi:hypothetical protein
MHLLVPCRHDAIQVAPVLRGCSAPRLSPRSLVIALRAPDSKCVAFQALASVFRAATPTVQQMAALADRLPMPAQRLGERLARHGSAISAACRCKRLCAPLKSRWTIAYMMDEIVVYSTVDIGIPTRSIALQMKICHFLLKLLCLATSLWPSISTKYYMQH